MTEEEFAQYQKDLKELVVSDSDKKKNKLRNKRKELLEQGNDC